MSKKTLIAGPWVGEFGWELFAWQAYVRALSRSFDETIIISRENSKAIYKDFCDRYITFGPPNNLADSYFMHNFDVNGAIIKITKENNISLNKNTTLFLPKRIGFPPHTHHAEEISFGPYAVKPEYIRFGKETKNKYDYVFHIRNRELRKEDNWSIDKWDMLLQLLSPSKVACIGTIRDSGLIDGADDLRGVELSKVFDILRNANCVFGPSSGPMHLSSLCGSPHVVWSRKENYIRYTKNWNPLNTPVLFDSTHSWHPTPEYIHSKFLEWRVK